jgi:hypothetical protein
VISGESRRLTALPAACPGLLPPSPRCFAPEPRPRCALSLAPQHGVREFGICVGDPRCANGGLPRARAPSVRLQREGLSRLDVSVSFGNLNSRWAGEMRAYRLASLLVTTLMLSVIAGVGYFPFG